ncbi:unnamed protein product [Prorocentrum cordatum]|uniref:RING-type domain-containing protein n=1 Tax=Prorocentrum cordatum TaxID=2364126 RepID=A0ABN9SNJ5_9DINO|nr:unnamed protein product [Polarella glacialis]
MKRPSPVETELGECVICLDRERSRAFLPCGHLCACADCATFMSARGDKCPSPASRHGSFSSFLSVVATKAPSFLMFCFSGALCETLDTVLQNRSQSLAGVAEGVATAPAAVKLARKLGVDTPVADAVAAVISQSMGAREAMMSMMQKPPRGDFSADGHRAETAMESKKGSLLGLPPVAWAALAAAEAAALACLAVWAARRQK